MAKLRAESSDHATLTVRFPRAVLEEMRDCAAYNERSLNTEIVRAARAYAQKIRAEKATALHQDSALASPA